jgi:hypothetical protein
VAALATHETKLIAVGVTWRHERLLQYCHRPGAEAFHEFSVERKTACEKNSCSDTPVFPVGI